VDTTNSTGFDLVRMAELLHLHGHLTDEEYAEAARLAAAAAGAANAAPPAPEPPRVAVDPAAVRAWLARPADQSPDESNADMLGVGDTFGREQPYLFSDLDRLLYETAEAGLLGVATGVLGLWNVCDGEGICDGGLLTVDLPIGVRLASLHIEIRRLFDRDARGVDAAIEALAAIAQEANELVAHYAATLPSPGQPA
jgi:hypothetical protein